MCRRRTFLTLIALAMVFCGISAYSLLAAAENEEEFSEQSFVQESTDRNLNNEQESRSYYYVDDEESSDYPDDEESSDYIEEESSYYYYDEESSYDYYDEESSYDYYDEESSYYYYDEESSYDYYDEESSYDYYDEESSYDYYSEPESSQPSYYEPSIYRETTEYYYDEEESSEPSSGYHETSIDNSELTSGDWEKLRERLSAEMKNKSSDNAIRDIKDSDSEHNDSISYFIWGIVLIAMGLALIGFVIYKTIYTKRKFS